MIDEPGSFAGKFSSPRPHLGPEPSHLMSLAIFIKEQARVLSAELAAASSSCADRAANLLGCDLNGKEVLSAILAQIIAEKSGCEFIPVPTAVPPIARSYKSSSAASMRFKFAQVALRSQRTLDQSLRG